MGGGCVRQGINMVHSRHRGTWWKGWAEERETGRTLPKNDALLKLKIWEKEDSQKPHPL